MHAKENLKSGGTGKFGSIFINCTIFFYVLTNHIANINCLSKDSLLMR